MDNLAVTSNCETMEVIARSAGKSTEQMAQNEGNRWMSGLIPLCPEIENGRAADPLPEILAGHHGWTDSVGVSLGTNWIQTQNTAFNWIAQDITNEGVGHYLNTNASLHE